ncbi:hypothetical protein [Deinococcus planocerae]|uniref:hypothetical protein n=1 Tax=Deinococcus planocerae TaxID=1737569 RepID=UPI001CA5A498|nr:hypothetical protein [Deinococcus planocerae]
MHAFRVDSETATLLNSYTPAGFERVITELGEPAHVPTLPPEGRPAAPGDPERAERLLREVGLHRVQEPDVLRAGHAGARP